MIIGWTICDKCCSEHGTSVVNIAMGKFLMLPCVAWRRRGWRPDAIMRQLTITHLDLQKNNATMYCVRWEISLISKPGLSDTAIWISDSELQRGRGRGRGFGRHAADNARDEAAGSVKHARHKNRRSIAGERFFGRRPIHPVMNANKKWFRRKIRNVSVSPHKKQLSCEFVLI